MAEFCLSCWNKLMETDDPPKKYIISRDLELCEGCGEGKTVIIRVKRRYGCAEWFCEIISRRKNGT